MDTNENGSYLIHRYPRVLLMFFTFSLDSEHVISETQDCLTGQDKLRFKEDILEGIREVCLPMKQKLRIRRQGGATLYISKLLKSLTY